MSNQANNERVPFIRREDIERRANQILQEHGLTSLPTDPVRLANRVGIKVNNAVFSVENLSGMIARRGPSISMLVNQADTPQRKRFTIAHELGHLFLHLHSDGDYIDPQETIDMFRGTEQFDAEMPDERRKEIQANAFAAALLMPEPYVREYYSKVPDVSALARIFDVSVPAMEVRLTQLGLR